MHLHYNSGQKKIPNGKGSTPSPGGGAAAGAAAQDPHDSEDFGEPHQADEAQDRHLGRSEGVVARLLRQPQNLRVVLFFYEVCSWVVFY